jgi:hypothetical protein
MSLLASTGCCVRQSSSGWNLQHTKQLLLWLQLMLLLPLLLLLLLLLLL